MTVRETQFVRLDRIEEKIDKMSEAIIQLARVEEKISDLEIRREEQHERLNRLSGKIDDIDTNVIQLIEKVGVMQKISWLFVGVFLSALATHFTNFV
jgi:tetrahydromethanopterin S-methyltransferase subunit G